MSSHHPKLNTADKAFERFNSQRTYYSKKGKNAKRLYYWLKGPELLGAMAIPALALLGVSAAVLGVVGTVVAALALAQEWLQPNANWIKFRTANERLKSEKALLDAESRRYDGSTAPMKIFAARVEEIVADENVGWATRMESAGRTQAG